MFNSDRLFKQPFFNAFKTRTPFLRDLLDLLDWEDIRTLDISCRGLLNNKERSDYLNIIGVLLAARTGFGT